MYGFLFLIAAAGTGPLFPFEGKPIVAVEIVGPEEESAALIRSLLDIQPGYLFSSDDLSRGVRRVYSLGRFADVAVFVTPMESAVLVTIQVQDQTRLGELTFSGDTEAELTHELKGSVPQDQVIEKSVLTQLEKRMEKLWET